MKDKFKLSTLCYIEKDNKYLMLHRVSKKNDINKDKYIGVGGHLKEGESPEDCLLREVYEETGLTLKSYRLRGIITFVTDISDTEFIFLYTSKEYEGNLIEDIDINEGVLKWIDKEKVKELDLWEGDKIFFDLMKKDEFFSLKLVYEKDKLVEAVKDGEKIS